MDKRHIFILHQLTESRCIKCPHLLLLLMANHKKSGWKTSDLTKAAGVSGPLVNMAKRSLMRSGLLMEHSQHRDRRVTKAYLTEKGQQEADRVWKLLRQLVRSEKILRAADRV